jgi:hypothetical protein
VVFEKNINAFALLLFLQMGKNRFFFRFVRVVFEKNINAFALLLFLQMGKNRFY